MMKCEFEQLIGHEVTLEEYEKVETVYMNIDDITKVKVADLCKTDDKFVTNVLYNHVMQDIRVNSERLSRIDKLHRKNSDCADSIAKLENDNAFLRQKIAQYVCNVDELETQLIQYRSLFTDIENNLTKDLRETLMSVAK